MKKIYLIILIITTLSLNTDLQSQQSVFDKIGQKSPKAKVEQKIGVTDISVNYYRPKVSKRKVWGMLVPYGQVWRAGANFATTINFSTNVKINGESLAAGKYNLFVIPKKGTWTFIFDNAPFQFGAFFYTGKNDVLRVSSSSKRISHVESLTYSFDNIGYNQGELSLAWGKMAGMFTISTSDDEILTKVESLAAEAIKSKNSDNLVTLVAWAIDHDKLLNKAKVWLGESIKLGRNFSNEFQTARFMAHEKKWEEAIARAEQIAIDYPRFSSIPPSFIERWKKEIE